MFCKLLLEWLRLQKVAFAPLTRYRKTLEWDMFEYHRDSEMKYIETCIFNFQKYFLVRIIGIDILNNCSTNHYFWIIVNIWYEKITVNEMSQTFIIWKQWHVLSNLLYVCINVTHYNYYYLHQHIYYFYWC